MVLAVAGLVLLVPNLLSVAALVVLVVAVVLQVTYVEEPHLRRVHGESFDQYRRSAGRFLPRLVRGSTQ